MEDKNILDDDEFRDMVCLMRDYYIREVTLGRSDEDYLFFLTTKASVREFREAFRLAMTIPGDTDVSQ